MKALFCLILSFTLISCKDDFFSRQETGDGKLSEVYFEKDKMYVYEYNGQGLLVAEGSKWHYTAYSYDQRSRVVSADFYEDLGMASSSSVIAEKAMNSTEWVSPQNTAKAATVQYRFDEDKRLISSTERVPGYRSEYVYDTGSRITERRMYHQEKLSGVREYTYDSQGNMIRDAYYYILEGGARQLSSVTEYEFDNGKNPYFNLSPVAVPGENTNPNNITRKRYRVTGYPESDTRYTYSYNSAGYPVKRDHPDFVTYYKY